MGDDIKPTQVKGTYLELSENEKKLADAVLAETKSFLVSGFKDEVNKLRQEWERETDPSTRPGFSTTSPAASDTVEIDIKRYGSLKRAVVNKATGQTVGWRDASTLQSAKLPADHAVGTSQGGWLPPVQMGADDREAMGREFGEFVGDLAKKDSRFNVLKFPRF